MRAARGTIARAPFCEQSQGMPDVSRTSHSSARSSPLLKRNVRVAGGRAVWQSGSLPYGRRVLRSHLRGALATVLAALLLPGCADGGALNQTPPTADTSPTVGSPSPAITPEVREAELAIAEAVNDERRKEGLEPLETRADLTMVARQYSERMLEEDFFDHVGPEGNDVADRLRDAGIQFRAVGENIYMGRGPVDHVETAVSGWMRSPGHRENILRDVFSQTGVGMARRGDTVYVTQVFLTP